MTSSLKRWIENGAPDKGDLEEDSYKILKQIYLKRKDLLYLNKDGIVACTEHFTTVISPHMMLTGHEKALPLTFFYPEFEGKRTVPQTYMRDVIRRQQDLNDLCKRNTKRGG